MAPVDYSIKGIERLVKFDGKIKKVDFTRLTAPGENYVSLVLKVDFEVEKNGQSKIISTVVKRLPISMKNGPIDFHSTLMKNEIIWYREILPKLKKFAKEHQIEGMDVFPEFYGARYSLDSSKQEVDHDVVLILENLIPLGYENEDRYVGLDYATSQATLRSLALFQALPIVIKKKDPTLFEFLKDFLINTDPHKPGKIRRPPGPPPDKTPQQVLFDEITKITEAAPYISRIQPVLDKPVRGPEAVNKLAKEPWNTIQHNDFWCNNVMVNFKNGKEHPLIKLVDFQMCSYGSYAKDLVFFLLSSVRNDVVREYIDDLLRLYYDEFTGILRKANVDWEMRYEEYLEEVHRVAKETEIGHALFFSTIIFGKKGGAGPDIHVEGADPGDFMTNMIRSMNQHQKDKLVVIASEAVKHNWI